MWVNIPYMNDVLTVWRGLKSTLPLPCQKHPSISLTTSRTLQHDRLSTPTRDVRRKSPQMIGTPQKHIKPPQNRTNG